MTAPCECEHGNLVGEPRRKLVVNMRGASHPMEKQKGLSFAAPIQILKLHFVDPDESGFVRRLVSPIGMRVYRKADHQRYCCPPVLCPLRNHTTCRDA